MGPGEPSRKRAQASSGSAFSRRERVILVRAAATLSRAFLSRNGELTTEVLSTENQHQSRRNAAPRLVLELVFAARSVFRSFILALSLQELARGTLWVDLVNNGTGRAKQKASSGLLRVGLLKERSTAFSLATSSPGTHAQGRNAPE